MTLYYRNTGNTDWNTATNWSQSSGGPGDGSVPTLNDDVVFPTGSPACVISANAFAKSITYLAVSTLTINVGVSLTVKEYFFAGGFPATAHLSVKSGTPGTRVNLSVSGNNNLGYVDFTDINSIGRTIYTFNGIVSNCINITSFSDKTSFQTIASSSIL